VIHEQQHDAAGQQEEDVLREQVRGRHVPRRVDDGRDHEEGQRGGDRVPGVEPGPGGVQQVRQQHDEEGDRVGEPHDPHDRRLT